jgi:hypothetical protein
METNVRIVTGKSKSTGKRMLGMKIEEGRKEKHFSNA